MGFIIAVFYLSFKTVWIFLKVILYLAVFSVLINCYDQRERLATGFANSSE